jgi:hypothetical protein
MEDAMAEADLWDERFQCDVRAIEYDFARREGAARFPAGCCCDMEGCIQVFEAIDPRVDCIFTYEGGQGDTWYQKIDGKWEAFSPEGKL